MWCVFLFRLRVWEILWGVLLFWARAGTLLASDGKWVCGLFPNWEILRCLEKRCIWAFLPLKKVPYVLKINRLVEFLRSLQQKVLKLVRSPYQTCAEMLSLLRTHTEQLK